MPLGELVSVVIDSAHFHFVAARLGKYPVRVDMERSILNASYRMGTEVTLV